LRLVILMTHVRCGSLDEKINEINDSETDVMLATMT